MLYLKIPHSIISQDKQGCPGNIVTLYHMMIELRELFELPRIALIL